MELTDQPRLENTAYETSCPCRDGGNGEIANGVASQEHELFGHGVSDIDPPAPSERHDVTGSAPITKRTLAPAVIAEPDGVDRSAAIREHRVRNKLSLPGRWQW